LVSELGDALLFGLTVSAMVVGLVLTFIPQVPGVLIIWLAALGYAILDKFDAPGPLMFALITLVGLAGATSDLWMKFLGAKTGGASIWGILAGAVLGLIGLIVFFPLGGIIGSIAGVMLVEFARTRDLSAVIRVGGGTLAGYLLSVVVELTLGLLTVGLFVGSVLAPRYF
jgi:uncharacterized protein YqgC (DUF456 family)